MSSYSEKQISARLKWLFVVSLFSLTLLALPAGILLRQPRGEDISVQEQRRLHQFPNFGTRSDLLNFPEAFEGYFLDRFVGRKELSWLYRYLMIKGFVRSPVRKVLMGEQGWLFLTGEGGDAVDLYHRNVKPFTVEELAAIHEELVNRREWVASWGGESLFVLVPNKETIYPEYLPPVYRRQATPQSRYDQWNEIFSKDLSLVHLDLRPILMEAKQKGLVYFRSDSHWNPDGAYIGYQAMVSKLRRWLPGIVPVGMPAIIKGRGGYRGDLAQMLAVGDWFDELDQGDYENVQEGGGQCAKPVALSSDGLAVPDKRAISVYECDKKDLPTAVLVRDSMANRWLPLLPDNFRRLVVMNNWFPDAELIEKEKPDVVIFENVERSLYQFLLVKLKYDPVSRHTRFVNVQ